jgi:hypothetical protein
MQSYLILCWAGKHNMNTLLMLLRTLQPNLEANDASIAAMLWFCDRAHLECTPPDKFHRQMDLVRKIWFEEQERRESPNYPCPLLEELQWVFVPDWPSDAEPEVVAKIVARRFQTAIEKLAT